MPLLNKGGDPGQAERDSGMKPKPGDCPCALAQEACRDRYAALYSRAQSLFRDLAMARADGSLRSLLARLSRIDVLVIDDWAMAPLSEPDRRSARAATRYVRRSSPRSLPFRAGTNRSAIPRWPTAFWTGWFTTPIVSRCAAIRCARAGER